MKKDVKAEIPKVILIYLAAWNFRNINTHTHTYLFPQTDTTTLTTKLKKIFEKWQTKDIYSNEMHTYYQEK